MGGLFDGLGIARSGLFAARAGVQLAGHNITNANTPGFHRRSLSVSPVDPPPLLGGGVQIDGAHRYDDRLLSRQVLLAIAGEAYSDTRQTALSQLEQAAADLGEYGLGKTISRLFDSLSNLASRPEDTSARQSVIDAADSVGEAFNRVIAGLTDLASGTNREIGTLVEQADQAAAQVAELNRQIVKARATGADVSDLQDRRDKKIDELAELVGAESFLDDEGLATVMIDGMTIVQGEHAANLTATGDSTLSGYFRVDVTSGTAQTNITTRIGGKIGALIGVRDQSIGNAIADFDQLAYDLADQINTQHLAGYGLDGVNNRTLFEPIGGSASGAAMRISLRAGITTDEVAASSTATGVPGDNVNALLLAELAGQDLAGGDAHV